MAPGRLDTDVARDAAEAMVAGGLSIGEVAALSATPVTTLRYYEKVGLVDPPRRVGGKRRYDGQVLVRLMVIRFCRIAGLGLDEIAEVVGDDSADRARTREIARERIAAIDEHVARLTVARDMMHAAVTCRCPTVERCDCGAVAAVLQRMAAAGVRI